MSGERSVVRPGGGRHMINGRGQPAGHPNGHCPHTDRRSPPNTTPLRPAPFYTPSLRVILTGTHGTGKTGKIATTKPCQGKHWEFGNVAKTQGKHREFGFLSCKFPDSKGKRYFKICCENLQIVLKLGKSAKSVLCM